MTQDQQANVGGERNIVVQYRGDGGHVSIGATPLLTLVRPDERRPRHGLSADLNLLNPYSRSIDLVGRDADLASLSQWLHSERPVSVRTVIGPAGAGKTRIAIELIEQLLAQEGDPWDAGFLTAAELVRVSSQQNFSGYHWSRPVLVVVDYAGTQTTALRPWLEELAAGDGRGPRRRVLLLEREASAKEGWLESLVSHSWSAARVAESFDPIEPMALAKLSAGGERRAVLAATLTAAAEKLARPAPTLPAQGSNAEFDRQLSSAVWDDPLYLMMAALKWLHEGRVYALALSRPELAIDVARREAERVRRFAPTGSGEAVERLLLHLAAYATLCGGLTAEQAHLAVRRESDALGIAFPSGPGSLAMTLHNAMPDSNGGVMAIVPDIIGEGFVLSTWQRLDYTAQNAAVLRAVSLVPRAIETVIRTAQDYAPANRAEPLAWLEHLIERGKADDVGLLRSIQEAMPTETMALREQAAEVCSAILRRLDGARAAPTDDCFLLEIDRAWLHNELSCRLSDLGRREDALAAIAPAVAICKQLAQARPDAFPVVLGASLGNLAMRFRDLGRRDEALAAIASAVEVCKRLAQVQPEVFERQLAISLSNQSLILQDLGRWQEALSAVRPAVEICERRAKSQPHSYEPVLAGTLTNLANCLSDLSRREEALAAIGQAVAVYERLAQVQPDAYDPDLGMSLSNQSAILHDLRRREESLTAIARAVEIRERLAQAQPLAFAHDLAASLALHALCLQSLGRNGEAFSAATRAVRAITAALVRCPNAFAGLASNIAADYLKSAEAAGEVPDEKLLKPIKEALAKTMQNPDAE